MIATTTTTTTTAYASDTNDCYEHQDCIDNCYGSGYRDGRDGDFEKQAFRDNCGSLDSDNYYYQGFIDGCISAGNSEHVCENFTDTG